MSAVLWLHYLGEQVKDLDAAAFREAIKEELQAVDEACRARDGTGHKLECSKISVDEVQGAEEDGGVGDPAVGPGGGPARLASLAEGYWGMITTATEDFNTCISRQIKDLAGDVGHCDMRVPLYQLPFN